MEAVQDFFISFNSADQEWAEWIAATLEAAGYSTIYQNWDFRPGQNFVVQMDGALARARRVLLVLSPNSLGSNFTKAEWTAAFAGDPAGLARRLIPVKVAPCELAGLLGPLIYIDVENASEDEAKRRILEGVAEKAARTAAPRFPGGRK